METGINGVDFTSEKKNTDFHFQSPILPTEKSKLNRKFIQFALLQRQGRYVQLKLLELLLHFCIVLIFPVNEKIYIFIWFWFLFLGLLSFLVILYRLTIIFSPYIRAYVIRLRFRQGGKIFSLILQNASNLKLDSVGSEKV